MRFSFFYAGRPAGFFWSKLRHLSRRPVSTVFLAFIVVSAICIIYLGYQVVTIPLDRDSIFVDKGKTSVLEERLQKLEQELWKNHQILGKLSDTVERIRKNRKESVPAISLESKRWSLDENPSEIERQILPSNNVNNSVLHPVDSDCPSYMLSSKSDIEMLEIYDKLSFENTDGGTWKQGWKITYDEKQWSNDAKLKVFVVPHSHNDPGWLKSFEKYYLDHTRHIFNNMVKKLGEDSKRKIIWAEVSYLSLWWDRSTSEEKRALKKFVDNGQLEIVTGGWVMNDEAVTHYSAMIEQMMEGHEWLQNHLAYYPENGWAIDPFGLSPTMAYLLKRMGLSHMVIQRVHYSVKKEFAKYQNLEFFWRQQWDHSNVTDMFCHLMPFYSYDVPHSCGPDPKVCCQFDFKRLPGNKVSCPWKVPPQPITEKNVHEKSRLILDQYRKKAQLFRTNVLFVPLGDDFRFDKAIEWDQQFSNYQRLFDYMNVQKEWNVQAQFGTLRDYFNAVEDEMLKKHHSNAVSESMDFPSLSGDFFTYADRDDHYWSGYFTSRPLYKSMDRILESYLRAAEIMFSTLLAHLAKQQIEQSFLVSQVLPQIVAARRNLGLFQHHDAITGTSRDPVVVDYANRLFQSIADLQDVIGKVAGTLLSPIGKETESLAISFDLDDNRASHSSISKKTLIQLTSEGRTVIFYNSLGHYRKEVVALLVSVPTICIYDPLNRTVPIQVNPVWQGKEVAEDQFEVVFVVNVPAIGLATYTLMLSDEFSACGEFSQFLFYNVVELPSSSQRWWKFEKGDGETISLRNKFIGATFTSKGLLETLTSLHDNSTHKVSVSFLMYGTTEKKDKSGAYLFIPGGEATAIEVKQPYVRVLKGPIISEVRVFLPHVEHTVQLKLSSGWDGVGVDVTNVVDITKEKNQEIVMRVETGISSPSEFYTDLNGFQMIRRKTIDKLPLQAQFYPVSTMAYIEDKSTRFTVLMGQPLGGASLKSSWLELVLDRRLNQDDNRGLQQGLLDNKLTPSSFRFLLERRATSDGPAADSVSLPSLSAHLSSYTLLNPVLRLIVVSDSGNAIVPTQTMSPIFTPLGEDLPCDVHLVHLRAAVSERLGEQDAFATKNFSVLLLHRLGFDCQVYTPQLSCQMSHGKINLSHLFNTHFQNDVTETTLTALYDFQTFSKSSVITLRPMELNAYKLFR